MEDPGEINLVADGPVLKIGISRATKKNGLTPVMMQELAAAFDRLEADDTLRVAILHGVGGNFTSGLDLMTFVPVWSGAIPAPVYDGIDPLQLKARCSKPIVAAVSGFVFTVGIELILACDIIIAADDCVFAQLETSRGIMVSGGGTVRWIQQCGWGNAMRYLLTADRFDAVEALRIGLVQEVVSTGSQLQRAEALAVILAANAPLAVRATKRSALQYLAEGESSTFQALGQAQAQLARSADAMEGAAAMMERRVPKFTGR